MSIYSYHVNRWSNVVWSSCGFQADKKFYDFLKFPINAMVCDITVNGTVLAKVKGIYARRASLTWARTAISNYGNVPISGEQSFESDANCDWSFLIESKEKHGTKVVLAAGDFPVLFGISFTESRHLARNEYTQSMSRCIGSVSDASSYFRRFGDDSSYVESGYRIINEPAHSEEHRPVLINLADQLHRKSCITAFERSGAVRANNYGLGCSNSDDAGTMAVGGSKANKKKKPCYMRLRSLGFTGSWPDTRDGSTVLDLLNRDIDLSVDGTIWFHFLGPKCVGHLPSWRAEKPKIPLPISVIYLPVVVDSNWGLCSTTR